MRQIPKAEWYLDKCTWCGVTKDGERYYPVSWNNDSTAYGMTKILSRCLDFHNAQQARKMLEAELKEDAFFATRYERIEFVELKVYPNGYFGFCEAAKKHNIAKVTHRMQTEEIKAILAEYGLEEVSGDELVIVSRRDNGEFFEQILADKSKNKSKIEKMRLEKSVYRGSTYLMKSVKDMELLIHNVRGAKCIGYLYNEEHKCFQTFTNDIYFPCLAVIYDDEEVSVHSLAEAREDVADANAMLAELEKLKCF